MKPPMPTLLRGDARNLPLPDNSVDLIVTSPPYFELRSYQDDGEHYEGQIGSEPTPGEFLDALAECTREMVRVLKPCGSLWINLGDKYSRQSLLGTPWRYALRCIDDLGLILRRDQIWSKPNGLPESATDRTRTAHEYWFHFTLQPQYYSAVDEIREPASDYARPNGAGRKPRGGQRPRAMLDTCNPLGRLPGSVWEIASQPLTVPDHVSHARCCAGRKRAGCEDGVNHYAAFPMEWPRRLMLGWSPREVCTVCGEGRRPVTHATKVPHWKGGTKGARHDGRDGADEPRTNTLRTITGYTCACSDTTAPSTPGVVLDPFGGTGTTALVAAMLGRRGISVDLSADYGRLAQWRTTDPKERARAAGTDAAKATPARPDQIDLFGGAA